MPETLTDSLECRVSYYCDPITYMPHAKLKHQLAMFHCLHDSSVRIFPGKLKSAGKKRFFSA